MKFDLVKDRKAVLFLVEVQAYEGVKRIAAKVAEDIRKVSGSKPEIIEESRLVIPEESTIVVATVGQSEHVESLFASGDLETGNLKSDREVYSYQFLGNTMYIIGSDKRGTIYGLFHLSELIGVSPLHYFADARIVRNESPSLDRETIFSKEPSVMYRGFFINDEWPAFGNWATETFGDVNAEAYDHIFEVLLRMKGNYLWPAMWNSSFSQDGPGLASAKLADLYGVIMGTSHHEPLCRAGVEWQQQYQNYGIGIDSDWNFMTNREAITAFWEDGVERNKPFENVITIGMRGESDSKLLPEDATMADNVQVLKEAILEQHRILRDKMDKPLSEVPRMLAIYKEVEQYYYGDHTCRGLKDWKELEDVIFLLSDDNHGNLRALPTEEERKHPGGFGMYYHVDYHGGPISYEWVNSTKISKIWEQMTTAYEYGIRSMWIVNVGDLKGSEYPLNFFMDLAYDYEKYGLSNVKCINTYPKQWVRTQLGASLSEDHVKDAADVLSGYIAFNAVRRPEYTNADVFHPTHYYEGIRMVNRAKSLLETAEKLHEELPAESIPAYESSIYYPAIASLHLHCMNILAGYNHYLAERGSLYANKVGEDALYHLHQMEKAVRDFHTCLNGKWNHMMQSAHTGFRSWDDYDWTYPVIHKVEPIPYPKAILGFRDHDRYHLGAHWQAGEPDLSTRFLGDIRERVYIDIHSRGSVDFTYEVLSDSAVIIFSKTSGKVEALGTGEDSLYVELNLENLDELPARESIATIWVLIYFADGSRTEMTLQLAMPAWEKATSRERFPLLNEGRDYFSRSAIFFAENYRVGKEGFIEIPDRGRFRDAIKCLPVTKDFSPKLLEIIAGGNAALEEEVLLSTPHLFYEFEVEEAGNHEVTFELVPVNPDHFGGRCTFFYQVNEGDLQICYGVSADYNTEYECREWDYGVVNHVRKVTQKIALISGWNSLTIFPGEPGFMLERFTVIKEGKSYKTSYLGPQ